MKSIYKLSAVLVAGAMFGACNDLDVQPQGSTVTTDQKEEVVKIDPEKASAAVTGLAGQMTSFGSLTGGSGSNEHWDIGIPALFIQMDERGQDMYSINSGYNWYLSSMRLSDALNTSDNPLIVWKYNYNQIHAANAIVKTIKPSVDVESTDESQNQSKFYLAQAYCFRAYAYLYLAQSFQFTYSGHENDLCVPILTEENEDIAAQEGCPRSTVQEVYNQILSDLGLAIRMLEGNPVTPQTVLSSKAKRFASVATAYGLRARAHLLMTKWAEAANDAQSAISNFSGRPLSLAEASVPGFNDIEAANWLWGIAVSESDRVVTMGICNFPSHMGSFCNGYATIVGAWKWINKNLYNAIPSTDVRKGWWLDANGLSSGLTAEQQAYVSGAGAGAGVQVKFAPYQGTVGQTVNSSDIPLMRIEEMYYIYAEATGMQSPSNGAQALQQFVQQYRDPSFTCTASSAQELQDAVWLQRRIELWGEGLSYYDMLRLKKPLDRVDGGWPAILTYRLDPTDPVLIYPIPFSEVNTNKQINQDENTLGGGIPTPVS